MKQGLLGQEYAPVATPVAVPVAAPVMVSATPVGVYQASDDDTTPVLTGDSAVEGKIMRSVTMERAYNDVFWAVLFSVGAAAALGGGYSTSTSIIAVGKDLNTCLSDMTPEKKRELSDDYPHFHDSGAAPDKSADTNMHVDIQQTLVKSSVVIIAAFAIGWLFIVLLEKEARIITWLSVCCMPILVFLSGLSAFNNSADVGHNKDCMMGDCHVQGMWSIGSSFFFALIIWCWRAQVELTAEILRMSAEAFKENTSLVWTTGGTSVLLTLLFVLPMVIMLYVVALPIAASSGSCDNCFQPSNSTAATPYGSKPPFGEKLKDLCPHQSQSIAQIMSWANGEDVDAGLTCLIGFMIIWVQMLSMEIRVSNVAGAIGLHYFEQDTGGKNRAVQALGWTMTTSFGSICYSSLILTIVKILDNMERNIREQARQGNNVGLKVAAEIIGCMWRYIKIYVEFLTKMAVISCAITGEAFCPSAKKTQKLLWRNNLDGILIDAFAGFTLFMLSLGVGLGLGYGAYFLAGTSDDALLVGLALGVASFMICMMVAGIVLVISNTHYLCYILDLDHRFAASARTQRIHELYSRAIDNKIGLMKKSPKKWAQTAQGKREAAGGAGVQVVNA